MAQKSSVQNLGQALLQIIASLRQEGAKNQFGNALTRASTTVQPTMGDPTTIQMAGGAPATLNRYTGNQTVQTPTDYNQLLQSAGQNPDILPYLMQHLQTQGAIQGLQPKSEFKTVSPGSLYGTATGGNFSPQGYVPTTTRPANATSIPTGKTKVENNIVMKEVIDVDPVSRKPLQGATPRYEPWQQQPQSAQTPPTVGAGKTGEALLAEIPENVRSVVKGIADGTMRPEDALSFRGVGQYSKTYIMNLVGQYNPAYEGGWNRAVWNLQKDATTGRIGKIMSSMNMTVGHLKTFSDAASDIGNISIQAGNTVKNWIAENLGSPKVTALKTSMKAVTSELSGLLKAGIGTASPTDQEMQEYEKIVSLSSAPEQFDEFRDTALHLIASRMEALRHQAEPLKGHLPGNFSFISPKAQQILEGFGVNSGDFNSSAPSGTQEFNVNGRTYRIPANEVEEFKRDMGIK